jgi:hypothetical protein
MAIERAARIRFRDIVNGPHVRYLQDIVRTRASYVEIGRYVLARN